MNDLALPAIQTITPLPRPTQAAYGEFLLKLLISLVRSKRAMSKLCARLGRSYVFSVDGRIPVEDLPIWLEFVEKVAMPFNKETAWIIEEYNAFGTVELPHSLGDFLLYHYEWLHRHEAWIADPSIEYSYHAAKNFPTEIDAWVLDELAKVAYGA